MFLSDRIVLKTILQLGDLIKPKITNPRSFSRPFDRRLDHPKDDMEMVSVLVILMMFRAADSDLAGPSGPSPSSVSLSGYSYFSRFLRPTVRPSFTGKRRNYGKRPVTCNCTLDLS